MKFWDYLEDYQNNREEILSSVDAAIQSGLIILGKNVSEFENSFAIFCDSHYGVGVDNGTNAIYLALKCLDIGSGDEVITVANTAIPTVTAIEMTGARAVFVDVEADTCLLNVDLLEEAITEKTKAILPVHLYGQPVDMGKLMALSQKTDIPVLEDCAQAHGATYNGQKVGSFGLMGSFSFYPTKPLGAYGDGGMIVTQNRGLSERLKRMRFYGIRDNYCSEEFGINSRLDEIQAAILLNKLANYTDRNLKLKKLVTLYRNGLSESGVKVLRLSTEKSSANHLFVVRHEKREQIIEALSMIGIPTKIHYPYPIHLMPAFKHLNTGSRCLPETVRACNEVFSLPLYPELSAESVKKVCESITMLVKQL